MDLLKLRDMILARVTLNFAMYGEAVAFEPFPPAILSSYQLGEFVPKRAQRDGEKRFSL